MPVTSPFTAIEGAMWDTLEACSLVTAIVRTGNRVKFNQSTLPNPIRDSVLPEDLPELIIYPQGGAFNRVDTGVSSDSGSIVQTYAVGFTVGDLRTSPTGLVNDLKWAIYVAFERARRSSVPFFGTGITYLRNFRVSDFTDAIASAGIEGQPQRPRGWTGVVTLSVEMVFSIAEILDSGTAAGPGYSVGIDFTGMT